MSERKRVQGEGGRSQEARPGAASTRCAVYTRKSTEEGLEQEFNSLDAQREACEAFITSQKSEGWTCLPETYADGGFSGGTMERPGLQRLIADIEAGKVDCVVTYKVDRLSRSLLDFARMMEVFERKRISFVSVTQQFNTASSMGRLILNVLLSFAQFEREIIAERTRDKMSAARRKGKWVGGNVLLGYNVHPKGGRLVVNEEEAARVREIFRIYLKEESLLDTVRELRRRGWTAKLQASRNGVPRGGRPFDKSSLLYLLKSRTVIGQVEYGGEVYPGEHPAIVDEAIWERAQECFRRNGRGARNEGRRSPEALLRGVLACRSCGRAMSPHFTVNGGNKRYRYYVCGTASKQGWDRCPTKSLPAEEIERFVAAQVREVASDPRLRAKVIERAEEQGKARRTELLEARAAAVRQIKEGVAKVRELASRLGSAGSGDVDSAGELAEVHRRTREAEIRLATIRKELEGLGKLDLVESDFERALSAFETVWSQLDAREKGRVLRLLLERVDYDSAKETVFLTFRPNGIKVLAGNDEAGAKEVA
jgi:site-specific DNA recombinase